MTPEQLEEKARMAAFASYWGDGSDDRTDIEKLHAALDKYRTILSEGIGFTKPEQEQQEPEQPTLRDQFAMAALPAVFISPNLDKERIGQHCYELADDLIAARKAEGIK